MHKPGASSPASTSFPLRCSTSPCWSSEGHRKRRHFEIFVILALAYLAFIAVAFLVDARSLIFPRFILDESIGFHADRARGPFLQAVANGVSLNILGILVLALSQKRKTSSGCFGWFCRWPCLPP